MRSEIQEALRLIWRKDAESLDRALAILQDIVFSFSMKVCGHQEDAEDTMQEVLLKSVSYLPKFNNPKALTVWLYKVAKNRCLLSRRKSKFAPKEAFSLEALMPNRRELAELSSNNEENPERLLLRRETGQHLQHAIGKLPPEYRLILVLRDMEELTDKEVAEITGLRPGTIRVRLHRARLFERRELSGRNRGKRLPRATSEVRITSKTPSYHCKRMFAELSNYLDDELDDSLCEEFEKHMEACEPCRAFLSTLAKSVEECRNARHKSPDPRVGAALRKKLISRYQDLTASLESVRNRNMVKAR